MKIYDSILELIGGTPIIKLSRFSREYGAKSVIYGKAERFNPCGSAKDRAALYMINDALEKGRIDKNTLIIEATSGNTGVALAAVCAALSLRCVIVMPENMSDERKKLIAAYGAELVLTPASSGMIGAVASAKELAEKAGNAFIPDQFTNPANTKAHYETTAREIWEATDGRISAFVAGVGSGGTISGIGKFLKEKNPEITVYAVEPASSPVISGGKAGGHKIQGIGANFMPQNFDKSVVDKIIDVTDDEAYAAARLVARSEGLLCGISSGAALHAASIAVAKQGSEALVVALLPDTGERYLSVL